MRPTFEVKQRPSGCIEFHEDIEVGLGEDEIGHCDLWLVKTQP